MSAPVLLITPPFTQLNTPYPATAYLKGFLLERSIPSCQIDLGIETILEIFRRASLEKIFHHIASLSDLTDMENSMCAHASDYGNTIDEVIAFMQGKDPSLAPRIVFENFLPKGVRIAQLEENDWAYDALTIEDKAKHLCTLYIEDLADLIKNTIDPYFGFSRYAERLARSANTFDELYTALQSPLTFTDERMLDLLDAHIQRQQPALVAITAPFPGNVYAAFRCAGYIKHKHPHIPIAFGGGFANTELRSLRDPRVFEFFDFITLDDGEAPLECIWKYIHGEIATHQLKRTFILQQDRVTFIDDPACADYAFAQTGVPSYTDLLLDKYIHAIEIINPMHNLWSNGRWNKLTMAHGCYWGKCTFCDISLPYIADYVPLTATEIVDRMEALIQSTGENGFHFVDEAAPPALMRDVALEILRRKLVVRWWTNIRFEKSFTRDLCLLLKASGCIAVSGGLEVASDRLLELIRKGVSVAQVTHVLRNFSEADIMVHAYLMYGFPTQTAQETIDSLEVVRQLFDAGVLQSAFWHRFAMTAHSPVGLLPEKFQVVAHRAAEIAFADNDVEFSDPSGADHALFSEGLRISLYNYMQGAGLDEPLQIWFDTPVPDTLLPEDHIAAILDDQPFALPQATRRVVFLGTLIQMTGRAKRKGSPPEMRMQFMLMHKEVQIQLPEPTANWLLAILPLLVPEAAAMSFGQMEALYVQNGFEEFPMIWVNVLNEVLILV